MSSFISDKRTVMTLDAGGTNFVFSAIRGCREIIEPICLKAITDNLDKCLELIAQGFQCVLEKLDNAPVAISFAFPGPADYANGIIGDLPNFGCFRGGVALGPFLKERFGLPVFINNDGNLFAYGEAAAGFLPYVNSILEEAGSTRRFKNLIGVTIGTGYGCGVFVDGRLLTGDNGCGGDVWLMRNKKYPALMCEESVSARAVTRVYREITGADVATPKDVFDIAEGIKEGDRHAAVKSFEELGEMAADAVIRALDIVDGLVVVGGGVLAASKYIIPAMKREMTESVMTFGGDAFQCLQMNVSNIDDETEREAFIKDGSKMVKLPFSNEVIRYLVDKKTAVGVSRLGTSRAVAIGAYALALNQIDALEPVSL